VAADPNPVDLAGTERSTPSPAAAFVYDIRFAGEAAHASPARMTARLRAENLSGTALADPLSVCWLLNLRGANAHTTPMLRARAPLTEAERAWLAAYTETVWTELQALLSPPARALLHAARL